MHKRLMLFASMALLGPAVARILPLLTSGPGPLSLVVQSAVRIGLPLTLVLHDWFDTRGVHGAVLVGATVYLVAMFGAVAIANSGAGAALIAVLAISRVPHGAHRPRLISSVAPGLCFVDVGRH